jgi:hypothetical protein
MAAGIRDQHFPTSLTGIGNPDGAADIQSGLRVERADTYAAIFGEYYVVCDVQDIGAIHVRIALGIHMEHALRVFRTDTDLGAHTGLHPTPSEGEENKS